MTRRFYIDCEFDGHDGSLLSIALVPESGGGIHIKTTAPVHDDWVRENVLPLMDKHEAEQSASVSLNDVGGVIRAFIGDCERPMIIADSPVDIGRFCRALSTGSDGGWAPADYPLMRFEAHNVDCYPTDLEGAVQHNAWWDAMALRHKLASVDTLPKGQDAKQGLAGTEGSAVTPKAGDAQRTPHMNNNPPNPPCNTDLTDVERVKDAIWSARQDAPNEAYALKMRLSYDEAMRAARAAIAAMPQQPIHADEVERAALASLTERFGARAAEYQREFDTSAWREELRVIRAALIVSDMSGVEMREALKPFAECADSYAETQPDQRQVIEHEPGIRTINLGDLRRARAALNPGKDEQ